MDKSFYQFIWRYSGRNQVLLALLTILSFPILYASLELPKIIINQAISHPVDARTVLGITFGPVAWLMTLCVVFLLLVLANGLFKMRINTMKGVVGERQVRRLRYILLERMLRFPLPHFARVSQGELISTVTAETEPLSGFIGDAFAQPLYQGGTMLTILLFLFVQEPMIGLTAIALIPLQAWIIPRMQRKVKLLGKERVKKVRQLSERIGEAVDNVREIRTNGTIRYTMAQFSRQLGHIFLIRLEIYERKFFIKFLNNFINQITPFFFFSIGGYFVLHGELSLGALVAALSAFKDLTAPWKELLDYYQNAVDAQIKYEQIEEQFSPAGLVSLPPRQEGQPTTLKAPWVLEDVSWRSEFGEPVLQQVSMEMRPGMTIGISGSNSLTLRRLAEVLVRLATPTSGRILVGGYPYADLPVDLVGQHTAYAGPEPRMFAGSIMQNVTYGLRHRPPEDNPDTMTDARRQEIHEAEASGNSTDSMDDIWTDFSMIGERDWETFRSWSSRCIAALGASQQVYERGLREMFDPDDYPFIATPLLKARHWLHSVIEERNLSGAVARFETDTFNRHASVAENMLFGLPDRKKLPVSALPQLESVRLLLVQHGLWETASQCGRRFAKKLATELSSGVGQESRLKRYPFLPDEIFDAMVVSVERLRRLEDKPNKGLSDAEHLMFIGLFLAIIPARDGDHMLPEAAIRAVLSIRRRLQDEMPEDLQGVVSALHPDIYNSQMTVLDNLLFGRIITEDPRELDALRALTEEALLKTDAHDFVLILVMLSEVGVGGALVPLTIRQRIQIVRGLVKKPDLFVQYQALGGYDPATRLEVYQRIRELLPDMILVILDETLPDHPVFDAHYTLEDGELIRRSGPATPIAAPPVPPPAPAPSAEGLAGPDAAGNAALRLLSRSTIFADLSESLLYRLASNATWRRVPAGDFVYRSGEAAEYLFLLAEGEAELVRLHPDRDPDHLAWIKPPEVIGDLELLAGSRRFSTIRAHTDLRLLRIDGTAIQRVLPAAPDLPMRVIAAVGRRLTSEHPPA